MGLPERLWIGYATRTLTLPRHQNATPNQKASSPSRLLACNPLDGHHEICRSGSASSTCSVGVGHACPTASVRVREGCRACRGVTRIKLSLPAS